MRIGNENAEIHPMRHGSRTAFVGDRGDGPLTTDPEHFACEFFVAGGACDSDSPDTKRDGLESAGPTVRIGKRQMALELGGQRFDLGGIGATRRCVAPWNLVRQRGQGTSPGDLLPIVGVEIDRDHFTRIRRRAQPSNEITLLGQDLREESRLRGKMSVERAARQVGCGHHAIDSDAGIAMASEEGRGTPEDPPAAPFLVFGPVPHGMMDII